MSIKCSGCEHKFTHPRVDVAECPRCGTENPTRHRKEVREELERNCKHLDVPNGAVGRAIAYSSAIYRFATHNERMDVSKIESRLASTYGESAAASQTKLSLVSGREYK